MELNCDTFIKQEFPTAEEDVNTTLPSLDLNIPVKNEPISDEFPPFVTIKEELPSEGISVEDLNIKTEKQLTIAADRFIIYIPPQIEPSNVTQFNQEKINVPSVKYNLQTSTPNNTTKVPALASDPPILLNAQLRKRHKVVLPVNPIDKRTRYNIEETHSQNKLTKSLAITSPPNSKKILNKCSLNKGSTRTMHRLIKPKPSQDEIPVISDKMLYHELIEKSVAIANREKNSSQITTTTTQTELNVTMPLLPSLQMPLKTENTLHVVREIKDPPIITELRVKCLCSLTADTSDTSKDSSELKAFFQEMFEETKRLNKTQQRKVKISLLQAISDAEELWEQGKCCGF